MKKAIVLSILVLTASISAFSQSVEAKKWSLQECVEHALNNNLDVQDSRLNLENAGYTLDQNNWNQYPSLNAGGGYGWNWGRSIDPTTNQFRTERINSIGVNANANMTLWNGMSVRNSIKQSRENVIASEFELQATQNNISLFVANSFLNVVQNKELLQNSQFQLEIVKEQLDRTNKLVNAGSLPISNRLDLESQVATAELNVINAENAVALSMLNLKQLLLIPASEPFDVEVPEVGDPQDLTQKTPGSIYDIASGFLPDLRAVEFREQSAETGLKVAKGGYQPSLSINAGVRTNYSSAADRQRFVLDGTSQEVNNNSVGFLTDANGNVGTQLYENPFGSFTTADISTVEGFTIEDGYSVGQQLDDNLSQNLSINLSVPIFNNMQTRINVQRSKIAYERALINKQRTQNSVRNDIEQAYNNAVANSKTFQARQKQVQALQEAFRVTDQRYNLGVVNSTDYQVALNNLNAAETDLVRAKYDYIFSLKVLDFYEGKPLY